MIYSEYPINPANIVFQVADVNCPPVYQYAPQGEERQPKTNKDGDFCYEVQLMVTSEGRMTLEKCKLWAKESPVKNMQAGQVVDLVEPRIYCGMTDKGQKYFGLKAALLGKAGK